MRASIWHVVPRIQNCPMQHWKMDGSSKFIVSKTILQNTKRLAIQRSYLLRVVGIDLLILPWDCAFTFSKRLFCTRQQQFELLTDIPQSILSLGSSLNGSNIKEGDDVYFECSVRANPKPYKVSWRFNETPLISNPHAGIIISNQSLVLQDVKRQQSGIYTCVAHNIEGDGVSNPMTLNIRCKLSLDSCSMYNLYI